MDVRLSPEQRALRDSAALVADRLGPRAVGQLDDPDRAAELDAAVRGAGWRELRDAADPGEGAPAAPLASGVEVAVVAEELGRRVADAAFLGPTLAAELRRLAGAPPAASPETVVLTPDLSALAVVAGGAGGPGAVPAGVPPGAVAVDVAGATSALTLVLAAGGYELARVEVNRGVVGGANGGSGGDARVDLTRPVAAPEPPVAVQPLAGQARALTEDDVTRWRALGLAVTCADLVGTMAGAVALACDHATQRRQYGVPIGSFQAVQHLLADACVATEGSRSVALHAAWAVDALAPADAAVAGAVAKAYCARAARAVCETAIQVHGGIGNTWDCLAHVHLRRALLSSDVLGGVGPSLARVLEHRGIGGGHGLR